jgi:putative hydrolase of the HAD superfamily
MSSFEAVIFDLGGVVFPSPFESFDRHDGRAGLPAGFTRRLIRTSSETGAWAALERGELSMSEFFAALEAEAELLGERVDAARIMAGIAEDSGARPAMIVAIDRLREHGLRVGALTNNWAYDTPERDGAGRTTRTESNGVTGVADRFDAIVESAKVGLRKPDPRIYELALERLGSTAPRTVFLDDLGINLKPARAMGMATIKVVDPDTAIDELAAIVGLELR